ncbi:MAG: S8 family serine peptidase [Myxococcota bacterium]
MIYFLILSLFPITNTFSISRVDPRIAIYLNSPKQRQMVYNPKYITRKVAYSNRAPVTVRLKNTKDLELLEQLESEHLIISRRGDSVIKIGNIVALKVDKVGLKILEDADFIKRIELDRPARYQPPTGVTADLISTESTRHSKMQEFSQLVSGQGMLLADLDSAVDPYQPAFFKDDGGYFSWFDRNDDGIFIPGVDGIDLNNNQQLDEGEILDYIDARIYSYFGVIDFIGGESTGGGQFNLETDYLYLDMNGNGKRDDYSGLGLEEPGDSFGEPFFIIDDINNNGRLDPSEKIIKLGSSKIKAVFTSGKEFARGVDLHEVQVDYDSGHATGVCGIAAGGQILSSIPTGIAPNTEIIVANAYGETGYFELLQWALSYEPQVVLHEYANNFGEFLDGSSNVEAAMDSSSDEGVVHVAAAGNHGGSLKGYKSQIQPGENRNISLFLPGGQSAPAYIEITLLWRDLDTIFDLNLQDADGNIYDMSSNTTQVETLGDDIYYYVVLDQSSKGTIMADIVIWRMDNNNNYLSLPGGDYTLNVVHPDPEGTPVILHGFCSDMDSGWEEGFRWEEDTSEEHLVGFPGTADSAITVAAYVGRDEPEIDFYDQTQGEIRDYSGRGHRIDGSPLIDVGAPANPLSASCMYCDESYNFYGDLIVFGGTSGAAPHVAGGAILIKELYPEETGWQIKSRIQMGALVDADVVEKFSLPVEDIWGWGKFRIYESIYGEMPPVSSPPSVDSTSLVLQVGDTVEINISASDEQTSPQNLLYRFDNNYDGVWDTEPKPDSIFSFNAETEGEFIAKVQVIDEDGFIDEGLITVKVEDNNTNQDAGTDSGTDTDMDSGNEEVNSNDGGCSCNSVNDSGRSLPPFILVFAMFVIIRLWFCRSRICKT